MDTYVIETRREHDQERPGFICGGGGIDLVRLAGASCPRHIPVNVDDGVSDRRAIGSVTRPENSVGPVDCAHAAIVQNKDAVNNKVFMRSQDKRAVNQQHKKLVAKC